MPEEECTAIIDITTLHARDIVEALSPDNRVSPSHVKVNCYSDKMLHCSIVITGCKKPNRILTLRNTIDDLILSIKASLETLEKLE